MKSLCIKTNNSNLLDYLKNELKNSDIKDICFSENQFKHYKNIIIHYLGNDNNYFIYKISSLLTFLVIDELEDDFLKNIIIQNYFYFDKNERSKILQICYDIITDNFYETFDKKFNILLEHFSQYIYMSKTILLSGFFNFRITDYKNILSRVVEDAVNTYIVEKEYLEFISLLKLYINSQQSKSNVVHLIYTSSTSTLLDENKDIIDITNDIFKAKFLSDISFSSNDYALNSLLSLLPKKIYIHLIDKNIDEFIATLSLIFDKRIELCFDCNICKMYKNIFSKNSKETKSSR